MYKKLLADIKHLKKTVPSFSVGKSVCGQDIICFKLGGGNPKIIIQCAIHAREHITSFMGLKAISFLSNFKFTGTIYYIPCANPDGVRLALDGLKSTPKKYHNKLLKINKSNNFLLYKANISGVDLNVNFDAKWAFGKQNIGKPAPSNYVGQNPNSESETKALIALTKKIKPHLTLSYHSKGEEVYYGFNHSQTTKTPKNNNQKKHLQTICNLTDYKAVKIKGSSGGYKDWCVYRQNIPAYTIEVGSDMLNHPLPLDELDSIFEKNKYVPLALLKLLQ